MRTNAKTCVPGLAVGKRLHLISARSDGVGLLALKVSNEARQ